MPRRIYAPIFDARIAALNADTGRPCSGFGKDGFINQLENLGRSPPGFTISTSPPLIIKNRMIVGSPPCGQLSAIDLKTRKLLWKVSLGTSRDTGPFGLRLPLPLDTGAPNIGGTV